MPGHGTRGSPAKACAGRAAGMRAPGTAGAAWRGRLQRAQHSVDCSGGVGHKDQVAGLGTHQLRMKKVMVGVGGRGEGVVRGW